ncbi:MAG: tetratricopeptide repeat protein [Spirochaetia bacterium]
MSSQEKPQIPYPPADTTPLERINYISLPDDIERNIGDFKLDPTIPLPVELPKGSEQLIDSLSWEMIVAAMLKLFAYQPEHPHIDYFRRFIKVIQPNIVAEMTQTGIFKARNKEFELAEEIFRSLVNFAPEQVNTFVNLALVFEEKAKQQHERSESNAEEESINMAFEAYKRGTKFHPAAPDLHFSAGYFFLQQGNIPKAKEHFTTFLANISEDTEKAEQVRRVLKEIDTKRQDDLVFNEAFDFIKMGQEERGIERIRYFLDRNPEVWNAWFLLGWGLRKTGSYERAAEAFAKSLELNQDHPDTLNELAICNLELEEYSQAKQHLEKALQLEPENTKIISNLGILALKQGDSQLARRFFLTVLELDPDDPLAPRYIDKIDEQS